MKVLHYLAKGAALIFTSPVLFLFGAMMLVGWLPATLVLTRGSLLSNLLCMFQLLLLVVGKIGEGGLILGIAERAQDKSFTFTEGLDRALACLWRNLGIDVVLSLSTIVLVIMGAVLFIRDPESLKQLWGFNALWFGPLITLAYFAKCNLILHDTSLLASIWNAVLIVTNNLFVVGIMVIAEFIFMGVVFGLVLALNYGISPVPIGSEVVRLTLNDLLQIELSLPLSMLQFLGQGIVISWFIGSVTVAHRDFVREVAYPGLRS